MREILFRAKQKDSGKWIEGNLVWIDDNYEEFRATIIPKKNSDMASDMKETYIRFETWYNVDPETICQYTGLTDKNGTKIFEGDILRFENCSNYPVFWDSDYCAFGSCWYSDFDHLSKYRNVAIEVVGNIFDNPELLEDEG